MNYFGIYKVNSSYLLTYVRRIRGIFVSKENEYTRIRRRRFRSIAKCNFEVSANTDKYNIYENQLEIMALKDILADKTKKRTIGILGTIIIILATAGIFWHEAGTIAVKEPPRQGGSGEVVQPAAPANTTTNATHPHEEYTGTLMPNQYTDYTVSINQSAKRAVIFLDSIDDNADFDLYITSPNGETFNSATTSPDETVELSSSDITKGGYGDWTVEVKRYPIPLRPPSAEYKLTIDVYY